MLEPVLVAARTDCGRGRSAGRNTLVAVQTRNSPAIGLLSLHHRPKALPVDRWLRLIALPPARGKRHRFTQIMPPDERLAANAKRLREQAGKLSPGRERDILLEKARQDETASHMFEWLNSSGLKAPT
jgi:hypothetical protein